MQYIPYSLNIMPLLITSPPLTICMNLLRRYIYLQFMPPCPYMENLTRMEELCDSDEREEG